MTVANAQAGFCGAGLIPFNPQAVISKLDVKLRTPTRSATPGTDADPWASQTPHNPTDALLQTTLVKNRIAKHQGSSPSPIFETVAALAKGTEILAHQNTLLAAENHILRLANEALSKRRRAKKSRVCEGGALIVEDALDVLAQKDAEKEVQRNRRSKRGLQNEGKATARHCGTCGKTGHNAQTCQKDIDMPNVVHHRVAHITELRTFYGILSLCSYNLFHNNVTMSLPNREARIMLAIEAIQSADKISICKASALHEVPKSSVRYRLNGNMSRAET